MILFLRVILCFEFKRHTREILTLCLTESVADDRQYVLRKRAPPIQRL